MSLPSRERGLKSGHHPENDLPEVVAPFAGAWIEITSDTGTLSGIYRRSLRGSVDWNLWHAQKVIQWLCRSLRGSVDWNLCLHVASPTRTGSLPSRERGLKFNHILEDRSLVQSLPSRERGLKSCSWIMASRQQSRSLRGSVDWNTWEYWKITPIVVAPFAGAWIEIRIKSNHKTSYIVAPFAGAWIEILTLDVYYPLTVSRSLRGSAD